MAPNVHVREARTEADAAHERGEAGRGRAVARHVKMAQRAGSRDGAPEHIKGRVRERIPGEAACKDERALVIGGSQAGSSNNCSSVRLISSSSSNRTTAATSCWHGRQAGSDAAAHSPQVRQVRAAAHGAQQARHARALRDAVEQAERSARALPQDRGHARHGLDHHERALVHLVRETAVAQQEPREAAATCDAPPWARAAIAAAATCGTATTAAATTTWSTTTTTTATAAAAKVRSGATATTTTCTGTGTGTGITTWNGAARRRVDQRRKRCVELRQPRRARGVAHGVNVP